MYNKNLVIVESPAKARTIEKFLGKDYIVKSSFGHIRDLPKKGMSIDIEKGFKPKYEIPEDKKRIILQLKKEAKNSQMVWLASDEDREGEAIAWHLSETLGLGSKNAKRIVFHEITEPAIKKAISNPRDIDINLVNAQQARRVLDRIVGYELSPILWKKVRPGLSAGRVQSIAVRLIVEREREIQNFEPKSNYKVTGSFVTENNMQLQAELSDSLADEETVCALLEKLKTAKYIVGDIVQKPSLRNPSPPFTTSSLQQEASRKLNFSVKQTMTVAQKLYENGHITYMRTDSTSVSDIALSATANYIQDTYGERYVSVRQYKTKNSSAQEAHEAIRPTDIKKLKAGADEGQRKLYELIWKRMVASQMASARTSKTDVTINISNSKYTFIAKGEILIYDGFFKVYGGSKEDSILPELQIDDLLKADSINAHQFFSRPPARYSEASLVKALEDLGIGRPSTYAPTISTIQTRGYVEKANLEGFERQATNFSLINNQINKTQKAEVFGSDKNKLLPTHLAEITSDFLVKYFKDIINTSFTARAEEQLDEIAEGKLSWSTAIAGFYKTFHPLVTTANDANRHETSQAKLVGNDPKSNLPIYARFGKYGPMLQKGETEGETKPIFAPMPSGARLETVTLEEALTMFELPRLVGHTPDGKEIKANIGRFGPYVQIDKLFVSIKPHDPFSITEEEAIELYKKKLEIAANREIKIFTKEAIQVLNGQFGPYVTDGKKNARIPKIIDPKEITLIQAKELLAKSKPPRKKIPKRKK